MIYEFMLRGGNGKELLHFEAKNDTEADKQAHAYCAPRDATFVYVRRWLTDLPNADEAPTEPVSASEQREQTMNRERTRTRTTVARGPVDLGEQPDSAA